MDDRAHPNVTLPQSDRPPAGSLYGKLLKSHMAIAAIGIAVLLMALIMTARLRRQTVRLATVHGPTARAALNARSGVQRSLAALRGWMSIPDTALKDERRAAWRTEIAPALQELVVASQDPAAGVDANSLKLLQRTLADLEELQWWIEDVAQTPGNEPARVALTDTGETAATQSYEAISALMESERRRANSEGGSGRALGIMAEFRGTFTRSWTELGRFVSTGDPLNEGEYRRYLRQAAEAADQLAQLDNALEPVQREQVARIRQQFPAFEESGSEIIRLRRSETADVAQHLLATEAVPLARQSKELLDALARGQSHLARHEETRTVLLADLAIALLIALIVVMLLAAWLLSRLRAEQIMRPIAALSRATQSLALHTLHADIPITSDDELGELTASFNAMRSALEQAETTLRQNALLLQQEIDVRLAAERSLRASQDDLADYAARLERSNEELQQFAYVASHDLQEPLRKVASFCQLLRAQYSAQLDDQAQQYIQYAVDGAVRMKTLVSDLLSLSRVTSRGNPLKPVDTAAACDEAIDNLHAAIEESAGSVRRGDLPPIEADRTQLVQLFQNLIGNALKYRSERVPEVVIDAQRDGDHWRFAVRDNGIGIEPRFAERIFVIFQRLHSRDEFSGTGIGLAVCKKIVERMQGRIWVESEAGQGSVFFFTTPIVESSDVP